MKYQKFLPAVIVSSLIAGVGFAHGATSVSKHSTTPTSTQSSKSSASFVDLDRQARSSLSDDKVADRISRSHDEEGEDRKDLDREHRKDRDHLKQQDREGELSRRDQTRDFRDRDRRDIEHRDRESPEASLHHDGDDRFRGLSRADFEQDTHREAVREIMKASQIRVARLYSPKHRAGYHARMHRHSR